jgi:hypothetical protein
MATPAEQSALPSMGPVQVAQMVNRAAQSEMRIGLNTTAFGNVEVRTVVHAGDVGVLIGSEKGDLRSLLVNELPGIVHTLRQQDLRLNEVSFQGFASSGNMGSGSDAQARSFVPQSMSGHSPVTAASSEDITEPAVAVTPGRLQTGLSILA